MFNTFLSDYFQTLDVIGLVLPRTNDDVAELEVVLETDLYPGLQSSVGWEVPTLLSIESLGEDGFAIVSVVLWERTCVEFRVCDVEKLFVATAGGHALRRCKHFNE